MKKSAILNIAYGDYKWLYIGSCSGNCDAVNYKFIHYSQIRC